MKIGQLISIILILLVLLSSAIGFSQNDFESTSNQKGDHSQIVEDSNDAQLEFRRSIKVNISPTSKSRNTNSFFEAMRLVYKSKSHAPYNGYYQKYISVKPSVKKFIYQGAFLI